MRIYIYTHTQYVHTLIYRGADKSLARPGRKQARKHVRDARDFNNIETRAVIKFLHLQDKAPKEIHAVLTEALACFLPGKTKDLSAPLYLFLYIHTHTHTHTHTYIHAAISQLIFPPRPCEPLGPR